MSDDLLEHYHRELDHFRRQAGKFAQDHPKIAERLRLGADAAEDPHVERLIEAFAYLTARVRQKLEDEFPEISGAMLDVLYPHYQAPVPPMSVVQFKLDPEQVQLTTGQLLPRDTEIESEPVHGERCRFRTCYPVTLWPLEVKQAGLSQAPFVAPASPHVTAASVLRLALAVQTPELNISELGVRSLRFFIKAPTHAYRIYELIFNHTLGVSLAGSARDAQPVHLGKECLKAVGFEADEGMLPYPSRSFVGYRLLTEYFAFPQKFLFFDVMLPPLDNLSRLGTQIELYFYFNRSIPELGRVVNAETFPLGCAPVVNLYRQRAEPIALSQTSAEWQVVPDRRLPLSHEVYSIDGVTATPPQGESVEFQPFYSVKHTRGRGDRGARTFWHSTRRTATGTAELGDRGTEVFLSLVDLDFQPSSPADWTLDVETTCLNRGLASDLPFGGDQPRLQLRDGKGFVSRVTCLTAPTPPLRLPSRKGYLWRLVSHLALNHLSLTDDPKAESLREILRLYDFQDSDETRNQIDGILAVSSQRVVGSLRTGGPVSFCRGLEVTLEFDDERYTGGGLFLFASVIERFLGLYCTTNSFSKLVARVKGRKEELRRWPPRVGENILT